MHFCNGCLITGNHVLTAAQCIHEMFNFQEDPLPAISVRVNNEVYQVEHVEAHQLYNQFYRKQCTAHNVGLILV